MGSPVRFRGWFFRFAAAAVAMAVVFPVSALPLGSESSKNGASPLVRKAVKSWDEYREMEHAAFRRLALEALEARGAKADRENSDVHAFIEGCLAAIHKRPGAPKWDALLKQGQQLIDAGSNDGLVLRYYAVALSRNGRKDESKSLSPRALSRLEEQEYPHLFRFMTARNIANDSVDPDKGPNLHGEWRERALSELARSWEAGELQGEALRVAHNQLVNLDGGKAFPKVPWIEMYEKIQKPEQIDPWLLVLLRGEVEDRRAWDARGGGYASSVTEEGWREFHKHGTAAAKRLVEAWQIAPQRPEAARVMISKAMEGNDPSGQTTRFWFEETVRAQFDYGGAYSSYLWSLRPRWGGSHQEMVDLGRECLHSLRWDTYVPMFYLRTLRDVAGELPPYRWFSVFRQEGVREDLVRMFEGMQKGPLGERDGERLRMQYGAAMLWCGDYEKARELLPEKPLCKSTARFWDRYVTFLGRRWESVYAELAAYEGAHGDLAKKADYAVMRGQYNEARELFEKACKAYGTENVEAARAMSFRAALFAISDPAERIHSLGKCDLMHVCAWHGYADAVGILADGYHDVNKPDLNGETPARYARSEGHQAVEAVLRRHGADMGNAGVPDWPEISKAVYYGDSGKVARLIRKRVDLDVRTRGYQGGTPLLIASRRGKTDIARMLLKAGADVDAPNIHKRAPLDTAIRYGHGKIAHMLIQHGANVNHCRADSYTALLVALNYKQPEIALLLIEKGADVNAALKSGHTAMDLAARNGHTQVLSRLIEKGCDVNRKIEGGYTPLHQAAAGGNADCVRLLLEHGADRKAVEGDGETPLDVARRKGHLQVVSILESQ